MLIFYIQFRKMHNVVFRKPCCVANITRIILVGNSLCLFKRGFVTAESSHLERS